MELREYRQHQLDAITHDEEELKVIKTKGMRFYERSASDSEDIDITDDVIDRRLRHIAALHKIVEMLDREIAKKE
ncbi:hypothetical protein G6L33_08740 [Agrobacterium rhizogenes]|nr:hypothetical protein [Rhizobium rhizogenes]